MNRWTMAVLAVALTGVVTGCDNSPPPARVPVPSQGTLGPPRNDPAKPVPGQVPQSSVPATPVFTNPVPPTAAPIAVAPVPPVVVQPVQSPPVPQQIVPGFDPRIAAPPAWQVVTGPPPQAPGTFVDEPIVRDRLPEQRQFVDAYNRVGRPRIVVFVNRRLDASMVGIADAENPLGPPSPTITLDPQRVSVLGPGNSPQLGTSALVTPGQYDEVFAKTMDYQAVENILTDWLAAGGNTEIISPTLARARLTSDQVIALERGERGVLQDLTERLDADILIQVQARPTRQTSRGLEVRLIAEALNTRGGRSFGRAVVDIPPPLTKQQINVFTRFVARKLMDDMTQAWLTAAPVSATPPAPTPASPSPASPATVSPGTPAPATPSPAVPAP